MSTHAEFKVIIIGDSNVGKSTYMMRFAKKDFEGCSHSTIGADFEKVLVKVGDRSVYLKIWDTAGQERYRSVVTGLFRFSHGAIVMYDVSNEETFGNVPMWVETIRQHCGEVPIILVGNKCDKNSQIKIPDSGQKYARINNLQFFKSSARENVNVREVFEKMAAAILLKRDTEAEQAKLRSSNTDDMTSSIRLSQNTQVRTCCT